MIKSYQDLLGGTALVAIACVALRTNAHLSLGSANQIGPGMMPLVLCLLLILCGGLLILFSFFRATEAIEPMGWRGLIVVSLSMTVFAFTIQRFGLAIAVPLAVIFAGMALRGFNAKLLVALALFMTAVCVLLFRYALHMPIPVLVVPGTIYI